MPRKPRIPTHPLLRSLGPHLGPTKRGSKRAERLIEFITAELIEHTVHHVAEVVVITHRTLRDYNEEVSSRIGQHVIAAIVTAEGGYDDFSSTWRCDACDEITTTGPSLILANAILQGDIVCQRCGTAMSWS